MSAELPKTVRVPEHLAPVFLRAEEVVSAYFARLENRPSQGTIEIFGERYILVRAASLSVEFFALVRELFGPGREADADEFARNILFDLAHAIGKSDALDFHEKMGLDDPIARLSAGPIHFAYTGWAFVDILPESKAVAGSDYCMVYNHPYSFESEAWIKSGKPTNQATCIMNAGYSSGWCEESFGMELVASEVLCRARGDDSCRFVMAPPDRIEERLREYVASLPNAKVTSIPGFFARKRLEDELRASSSELERRVKARTRELFEANERLKAEIREREAVEARLRQTEKLEAVGRLTGGIAHDFNNILTVILGYTSLAMGELEEGSEARELIGEARKAADRAAGLTRQLMAFSRQQVLTPQVLSLNAVVTDMAQLLRRVIGEHIGLELELDPREPRIHADATQVEQVLMNLAVNARDAMPNGGRLKIETCALPSAKGPGQVQIRVSDTGIGMDAGTRGRVFEPFFTTKERAKGTGLGLATVHGIVTQSHGEILLDSEPGQGTTFTILLPATDAPLAADPYEVERAVPPGGPWTILLVEDEPGVRSLFGDILTKEGYRVLRAADPESAAQMAADHEGTIDLLLTDVVMPQQSGRKLAEELHAARPEMRVLFMSGYADKILESEGDFAFLQKPCGRNELTRKVREVLER